MFVRVGLLTHGLSGQGRRRRPGRWRGSARWLAGSGSPTPGARRTGLPPRELLRWGSALTVSAPAWPGAFGAARSVLQMLAVKVQGEVCERVWCLCRGSKVCPAVWRRACRRVCHHRCCWGTCDLSEALGGLGVNGILYLRRFSAPWSKRLYGFPRVCIF